MTTRERVTVVGHSSYIQVGLVLVLAGGMFWLGQVSARLTVTEDVAREAAKQAATVAENLAFTSATLAEVQRRLAEMP